MDSKQLADAWKSTAHRWNAEVIEMLGGRGIEVRTDDFMTWEKVTSGFSPNRVARWTVAIHRDCGGHAEHFMHRFETPVQSESTATNRMAGVYGTAAL